MTVHEDAHEIATAAGRVLLDLRERTPRGQAERAGRTDIGRLGDRLANEVILAAIGERHPGEPVLSEESADGTSRYGAPHVWIVDPLDGTREYSEGRSDWAVHVARCENGFPAVAAVALPCLGRTYSTASPLPAIGEAPERPRLVVSRTRPPRIAMIVAEALDADVVRMGSAGAKAMAVVSGDAEIYVHAGGQYEWDSAAPVGVALAAGLHASRLDGARIEYNRPAPRPSVPDLLVCLPGYVAAVLTVTRARRAEWT